MEITTELVETSTEARCRFMTFEASHRSVSSLDPAMVLLDPIVQILVRPVFHAFVQFGSDRARVTVMTIRRDTRGGDAGHGFGRSKECLRRLHVALLAQPDVDKGTKTINGTIKVAPAAAHLDVCLVNVPTLPDPAFPPPPEVVDQAWRQLRLPVPDRFIAEFDSPDQEYFRQITQAQLLAEAPDEHERDHVGRVLGAVQDSAAALIELLSTSTAPEAPVTPRRPLWSFGNLLRVALDAPHFPCPPVRRIIRRRVFTRPVDLGATDDRTASRGHTRRSAFRHRPSVDSVARSIVAYGERWEPPDRATSYRHPAPPGTADSPAGSLSPYRCWRASLAPPPQR